MTLLDNPKRQKVIIDNMKSNIKRVKHIYKTRKIMNVLDAEQKERSWQNVFNENKIIEQLVIFENNNEYLTVNATYLAVMVQFNFNYLKWITVLPNMDWYFYKDEHNRQTNDMIQCIVPNCPYKNKPICFMSWVPSNKPQIIYKYKTIQKKEYYEDRAYIMAVCDLHYHKFTKDESKVMTFMLDTILPLRKYEDKNGFVHLPDINKISTHFSEASKKMSEEFNKIGEAAHNTAEQVSKIVDKLEDKDNN